MPEIVLTPEASKGARSERIHLNPSEVAGADRIEIDLHAGPIQVREAGIDWGSAEVEAFMAQAQYGQKPIDFRLPNRVITIPLILGAVGDFDEARIALQAEVSRINEEGGTLKREIIGGTYGEAGDHLFCDLVKATLKLTDDTLVASQGLDANAELILEGLPDFYGDPITEAPFEGTGGASQTVVTKGNLPGRVDSLAVTDKSGSDQLGLGWHFRCRNFSPDESAAWMYEAEDLTPLDLASIALLSGASGTNGAVLHGSLGTSWTPVLSTNRLPKVRSVGAAAAGTGAVKPPLPAGVRENDILIMYVETENQAVALPAGWAQVSGSPVEVATGTTTRLTALWKRAGASESGPTVEDPGDHVIAQILAVSGCIRTGNPWNTTATATEMVADTTVSVPTATTTIDGCLVLAAVATGTDVSSSAHASSWANSNLQGLTERIDSWTAEGGGGGFGVASGVKLKAGAIGATTAAVITANFKALMTIALKPEVGGNFLTHVGVYDVTARVQTTSESPPWLRLVSGAGDLISPSENQQVQIPGANNFYLVPLGQISLPRSPRWQGIVQARGANGGENVYIDTLEFRDASEASGSLSALPRPGVGASGFVINEGFDQGAGALNGEAIPNAGTTWVTEGETGDFETTGGGLLIRSHIGDSSIRAARPASMTALSVFAMSLDFKWDRLPLLSSLKTVRSMLSCSATPGTNLRITGPVGSDGVAELFMATGGGATYKTLVRFEANVWYTLLIVFSPGARYAYLLKQGEAPGLPLLVGHGDSASGTAVLQDFCSESTATKRYYDNCRVYTPSLDAVIFGTRSASLATSGLFRQSPDGVASGSIGYPGGDLPRIPVSGPEGRPVEIAVRASRGNTSGVPDSGLGASQTRLTYRPCWSDVPAP